MTKNSSLVDALMAEVEHLLDARKLADVRIPALFHGLPTDDIIDRLEARGNVRVACFDTKVTSKARSISVTDDVKTAIIWRNESLEGRDDQPLVIVGSIADFTRAAGLSSVVSVRQSDVSRRLFNTVDQELKAKAAPQPTRKLVDAIRRFPKVTDLSRTADFVDSILSAKPNEMGRAARTELWRLGLLPDVVDAEIDRKRLRANWDLVTQLRSLDASQVQRVAQRAAQLGGEYKPLRQFSLTGDRRYLKSLRYQDIHEAMRATARKKNSGGAGDGDGPKGGQSSLEDDFTTVVESDEFDERQFLDDVKDRESGAPKTVSAAGHEFDWDGADTDNWSAFLGDDEGDEKNLTHPVCVETLEPGGEIVPGTGSSSWEDFANLRKQLSAIERRTDKSGTATRWLDAIEARRAELYEYLGSLPAEGVRLFLASEELTKSATDLVDSWVGLWESLGEIKSSLSPDDVGFLDTLANRLALIDVRIERAGEELIAYLLPLHPVVLEPRLRAARVYRDHPQLVADMYDLITESLDPGLPSILVRLPGHEFALAYSGQYRGLPEYRSTRPQFQSPEVPKTLIDVAERFVSVHPYAELSLHLAMLDPAPETASKVLKRLVTGERSQRVALDIYCIENDDAETRASIDQVIESLVNLGVPDHVYRVQIEKLPDTSAVVQRLQMPDRTPHILFFFDLSDYEAAYGGVHDTTPHLGSLVLEWQFRTNPLSEPIIQPRPGSGNIARIITAQAPVLGNVFPTVTRSPVVTAEKADLIGSLASHTTWVALSQGGGALVAPFRLSDLELVGRASSGAQYAYVYSSQPEFLLEPVVRYLGHVFYDRPERSELENFLFKTVRDGLPEGLLGFFKRSGSLAHASVLGRLGFASVLRKLLDEAPDVRLVISLDTAGARAWLGLREDSNQRADLVAITLKSDGNFEVDAVEVKTRDKSLSKGEAVPIVAEAEEQVEEMYRLLSQILLRTHEDALTPSRREILKRQVFVEALQQWEDCRLDNSEEYDLRIAQLNRLFVDDEADVQLGKRVFLVTPPGAKSIADFTTVGGVSVETLGIEWLKGQFESLEGAHEEIDAALLEGLIDVAPSDPAPDEHGPSGPDAASEEAATDDGLCAPESAGASNHPAVESKESDSARAEGERLASELRDALAARRAPFVSVSDDEVLVGPSVVQIPFRVRAGSKLSTLQAQENDLARDLGVQAVRILNFPGRAGFALAELPRSMREIPHVREVQAAQGPYPTVALGAAIDGTHFAVELEALPHLLVGGMTGSGKSVFLRSLLYQLTELHQPDALDLVLIDGKGMTDYIDFARAPQIRAQEDYCRDPDRALDLLEDIVEVRLRRMRTEFVSVAEKLAETNSGPTVTKLRDLLAARVPTTLRPLVVFIDEFADIAMTTKDRSRFEDLVTRFNQIARALGGHLIAATQRPSADVVTGVAKANFARVALRVQSNVDSRVILDESGAENLLGLGDLLFKSADAGLIRLQGFDAR